MNTVGEIVADVVKVAGIHEVESAIEVALVVKVETLFTVTFFISVIISTSSFVWTICCPLEVVLVGSATRPLIIVMFVGKVWFCTWGPFQKKIYHEGVQKEATSK